MRHSKLLLLPLLGIASGCATIKQSCPADPFDKSAPAYCKLLVTESEQQAEVNKVKRRGDELSAEGDDLSRKGDEQADSLATRTAEIRKLKGSLGEQEIRTRRADAKLAKLKADGSKSSAELKKIEQQINSVKEKLRTAKAIPGTGTGDVSELKRLRDELTTELDRILDL